MKEIPIIFENDEILLINKPSGISVQGGEGVSHPLDEELSKKLGYKIHLVHRLDKETSGLMVVAKNPAAASKWINLISSKQVKKEYTAICFGLPQINGKRQKSGVISGTVKKADKNQSAVTYFDVEKIAQIGLPPKTEGEEAETVEISQIHLTLGTGRMHQIRIHLASCLAPIAGDDRHGNFKLNKLAKKIGIKSLQLCSSKISIPIEGKLQIFEINLPDSFFVVK